MKDKIIQVSGFGVNNTQRTQTDYMLVALTQNGKVLLSQGDGKWADCTGVDIDDTSTLDDACDCKQLEDGADGCQNYITWGRCNLKRQVNEMEVVEWKKSCRMAK